MNEFTVHKQSKWTCFRICVRMLDHLNFLPSKHSSCFFSSSSSTFSSSSSSSSYVLVVWFSNIFSVWFWNFVYFSSMLFGSDEFSHIPILLDGRRIYKHLCKEEIFEFVSFFCMATKKRIPSLIRNFLATMFDVSLAKLHQTLTNLPKIV